MTLDGQKKLFWGMFIATLILLVLSLPISICCAGMLLQEYLAYLLIGAATCTGITVFVACSTCLSMRYYFETLIIESLMSIRNCLVQMHDDSYEASKESSSYKFHKQRICDTCEKILLRCELIRTNELFREPKRQKIFHSLDNVSIFATRTRQIIVSVVNNEKGEDKEWARKLKNGLPQYVNEVEDMIRRFAKKYCPNDIDHIKKVFDAFPLRGLDLTGMN